MPYSAIAFLWCEAGTTLEEFQRHYETVHIPLAVSLLGASWPTSHTRYYLPRPEEAASDGASLPTDHPTRAVAHWSTMPDGLDFDAIAYLCWNDEDDFNRCLLRRRDPEVVAKLQADEETFLLREKLVRTVASEPFV